MKQETEESPMPGLIGKICRKWRRNLVLIGLGHTILVVTTLWFLFRLNLESGLSQGPVPNRAAMINSSLLGFLGSLFYFGRKVYVYLITDKIRRFMQAQGLTEDLGNEALERLRGGVAGYYIYLSTRPLAGLVIGPLLLMAVLAGLTTFSVTTSPAELRVSAAGACLIYFISFVGGYSSSDLFDYLASLGAKLAQKLQIR